MKQRVAARKSDAGVARPAPSAVRKVVNSPGTALSAEARNLLEPRLGFDFSRVRVHADASAADGARAMDAAAYTVGQHIAFDTGRYEMQSQRGQRLLAHELAHTVQQRNAAPVSDLRMASTTDASEREAERVSTTVLGPEFSGLPAAVQARSGYGVQCQPNQTEQTSQASQSGPPELPELDLAKDASPLVAAAIGSVTIDRFVTGSADIPASQKAELTRTVKSITSLLRQYPGSTMEVIGNTDAIGKDADNQTLGQSRADAVQQALVTMGIPAEAIQTQSRGASDPVVKTKTENARNRRVEVRFHPARQFPGVLSGHLNLGSGDGGGTGIATPNVFNPDLSGFADKHGYGPNRPPSAPEGALKDVPSDIPYNLMDFKGYNQGFTSHGNRPDIGGDPRAAWAAAYRKYRYGWKLSKEMAAKAANAELSGTASQDQSRDSPNTQDQLNKDMKDLNPNGTSIGPFDIPFKPFKWEF